MLNDVLQDRMKWLKESEKGVGSMCALMEELQEKGKLEGELKVEQNKREMAINLLKLNMPKEQIIFVTGLSNEELSQLEASISE